MASTTIKNQFVESTKSPNIIQISGGQRVRNLLLMIWAFLVVGTIYAIAHVDDILIPNEEPVAFLVEKHGHVEKRLEQLAIWSPLEDNQKFYEQEIISTSENSSAKLRLTNNVVLDIGENSQIQLQAKLNEGNSADYTVKLLRGDLQMKELGALAAGSKESSTSNKSITIVSGEQTFKPTEKTGMIKLSKSTKSEEVKIVAVQGKVDVKEGTKTIQVNDIKEVPKLPEKEPPPDLKKLAAAASVHTLYEIDLKKKAPPIDFSKAKYTYEENKDEESPKDDLQNQGLVLLPTATPLAVATPTMIPTPVPIPTMAVIAKPTLVAALDPQLEELKFDPELLPKLTFSNRKVLWNFSSFIKRQPLSPLSIPLTTETTKKLKAVWSPVLRMAALGNPNHVLNVVGEASRKRPVVSVSGQNLYKFYNPQAANKGFMALHLIPGYEVKDGKVTQTYFANGGTEVQLNSLSDFLGTGNFELYLPNVQPKAGYKDGDWFEQKAVLKKENAKVRVFVDSPSAIEGLQPILANGIFAIDKAAPKPSGKGSYVIKDAKMLAKFSGQITQDEEKELTGMLGGDLTIKGQESDIVLLPADFAAREQQLLKMLDQFESINVLINGTVVKIDRIILTEKKMLFKSLAKQAQGVINDGVTYVQP